MGASFHDVLFPTDISYGSSGGPRFKTSIFSTDSGFEQRNITWTNIRCEYDAAQGIKNQTQMTTLIDFFMARQGRAYGFRFYDFSDFSISQGQIAVGDGSTTVFQVVKTYTNSQTESGETYTYTRPIKKPSWGTLAGLSVGGTVVTTGYTLDYTTGLLTFTTAPASGKPIVIGYMEFHVPVRFDTDIMAITQEFWNTTSWPHIPLVEVRDV